MNSQCVVIFPIYSSLKDIERKAFENAVAMTDGFKKVFIAPQSYHLDDTYGDILSTIDIVRFSDEFFNGIEGYNRLMMSESFYERFNEFEYMLIHQADAYIFKPELKYWCDQGYDYIGAPWVKENLSKADVDRAWKIKKFSFIYSAKKREERRFWLTINEVGNGGFSLRRIQTFIDVLKKVPSDVLDRFNQAKDNIYNEDVFWGLEAPKYKCRYKKPKFKDALRFSIEMGPSECYELLGRKLPFGCHAFAKFNPEFWAQFIPILE